VLTAGTEAFSLQSADAFELRADVDELDIASVREGQRAVVTVDTYPGDSFEGTVSAISGVAEVSGGVATYEVTVTLDPSMTLRTA
jgi:HlyD family secretion protein